MYLAIVTVNLLWMDITLSAFFEDRCMCCTVTKHKYIHWHEKHAGY